MKNGVLARRLGFFALVLYGIGDVLGAGIYALVGKVTGLAGSGAWLSFFMAALVAAVTGLSYAELSARFPVAAGAAAFIRRAFHNRYVATLTGVLVLATGLTSAATITVAFSGYFQELFSMPAFLIQTLFVAGLSFLSFWGILESSRVNIMLTVIEFSGLLAVIAVGFVLLHAGDVSTFLAKNPFEAGLSPILAGVTVAFFAYIGFEDLCNLAAEAKDPARDIPRAILISIFVSTILYMLVTVILQMTLAQEAIAASNTPLLLVFEQAGILWVIEGFALVAMLAIANTGLANLIMASRLIYGMSEEGLLHPIVGRVHRVRQTPWVGVVISGFLVLVLVTTGGLKILAQTTSLLILCVFLAVHGSLVRVKLKKENHRGFRTPLFFPLMGCVLCLTLIVRYPVEVYARSLIVFLAGSILWALQKRVGEPSNKVT